MRVHHVACVQDVTALVLWDRNPAACNQRDGGGHASTLEPLLLLGMIVV